MVNYPFINQTLKDINIPFTFRKPFIAQPNVKAYIHSLVDKTPEPKYYAHSLINSLSLTGFNLRYDNKYIDPPA